MISTKGKGFDIILITGDYYVDHPFSGAGVLAKVLEDKGYKVGIIEKPDWKSNKDFLKLGKPKLFFGVTSGAFDSMICNYTPLKRKRSEDKFKAYDSKIPDRATLVYCNKLKELFKGVPIIIGGVEASLRRFTHYDYWDNKLRRSILLDSRADLLVYGNGEKQIIEIAKRLKNKKELVGIKGTCVIASKIPKGFILLPSNEDCFNDKKKFCKLQLGINNKKIAQRSGNKSILQFEMPLYTSQDLDYIYGLDYSRDIPKHFPEFRMAQFSVVTHRGCIGKCNFCAISSLQGDKIVSRSEKSILDEIKKITKHKKFKGFIDDLGGPSANMYGMDCHQCSNSCMKCSKLNRSHSKLISLLKKVRKVEGIKKVFVRSGIRYDLAVDSFEYIKEISKFHISGSLKIAPEHFSLRVLKMLNKNNSRFTEFCELFFKVNRSLNQSLKYYFMTGLPGEDLQDTEILLRKMQKLKNTESVQIYTPTPGTISSCMYYTSLDPFSLRKIYVPYKYSTKKRMKEMLMRC